MEYVTPENIITAIVVLIMIFCLIKSFSGDFGANKTFYFIALAVLGFGLYFWRSGLALEFITDVFSIVE
jgi:hypothetical protein